VTLHDLIEKARASAQKLQPSEAAVLFAASVRLAATRGATLRSRLIEIDEAGGLHLLPFEENAPEPTPSYVAPEALAPGGPRRTEPRVQVYAAGALGYELLTGRPAPSGAPGNELAGALGDIVRIALAADRRERFGDLNQLQDALAGVQPRPPAEGERNILLALRTRFSRRPPEKEAVARLIEKVAAVEQQLAKMQARTESLREGFERFEEGERRRAERKAPSSALPGFVAGVAGAALVLAIAWFTGFAARAPSAVADNARVADAGTRTAAASPDEPPTPDDGSARDAAVSRVGRSRAAGAAVARPAAAAPAADASTAPADDNTAEASDDSADASQTASTSGASQSPADLASQSAPDASTSGDTAAARDAVTADASSEVANGSPSQNGSSTPQTSSPTVPPASNGRAAPGGTAPPSAPPPSASAPSHRTASARTAKQKGVSPSAINHALALSEVRRGESALEHGHADDAVSSFRSALDDEPGIAVAYRGLGMAYAVQGNDAEALRAYEKYLQLTPAAKDARDIRKSMAEIKDRGKLGEEK
jgi:hypothetical protein